MTDVVASSWRTGSGVPEDKPFGTIDVTPEFAAEFAKMSPEEQQELVDLATRNQLALYYGSFAAFFDIPEVADILLKAARLGYTPNKLEQELRQTKWWFETDINQKRYDAFVATSGGEDSATVQNIITDKAAEIGDVSAQLGARLSDEQTRLLARDALRNGYNQRTLQSAIATEMAKSPQAVESLRTGSIGRDVRRLATEYAVPLSDATLDKYMNNILNGTMTTDDFESYLRQQASSLYPSLANEIARGVSVRQYADPYREIAARTLGLSPDEIDFADPKWNMALNFDDGKGRRNMTLFEWGELLRKDERYGYDRTPSATGKAYSVVTDLGRMFGLTA